MICRRLSRLALGAALLLPALCLAAHVARAQDERPAGRLLDLLVAAYPDKLAGHDGQVLIWKDGSRMPFDDGAAVKTDEELLARPSVRDMFHWRYPLGMPEALPQTDPGRIRAAAFFDKMYGDCTRGGAVGDLVAVPWLPKKKGGVVQATRVNGVADKLAAVSAELDALPAEFDAFLVPSAGAYNCRPIAGTARVSAHGRGIAIDLSVKQADYWRWAKADITGTRAYRNRIPARIVQIFEQHGFIWGGKWRHFDTMHFEYRPEILAAARP